MPLNQQTDQQMQQLTDHIWVFPEDPDKRKIQPAVGVVSDGEETVLYDAGNSPSHAQAIIHAIAAAGLPPVTRIVYSHFHWDHIFGAQTFVDAGADVEIIAHETCRAAVAEYIRRPWGPDYLMQQIEQNPYLKIPYERILELIPDWDAFQVMPPTTVFDGLHHTLQLNGVTAVMVHRGGNHTQDGTALRILGENTVFLADCFYPAPPSRKHEDAGPDFAMMGQLIAGNFEYYVDGHYGIRTRADFIALYERWLARYGG